MSVAPTGWPLLAYGVLRMPLALLELPLFVLLPSFYSRTLGMELATIGAVLFATRLFDAVADPAIGLAMDRWRDRWSFRHWVAAGLPVLAIGFAALFMPPVEGSALVGWLAFASLVTYIAYSMVSIAYQSWGAELGSNAVERARVTTTREAFGLIGVLAAAALLTPERARWLVLAFIVLSVMAALALRHAPAPATRRPMPPGGATTSGTGAAVGDVADGSIAAGDATVPTTSGAAATGTARDAWAALRANRAFRWLLAAFVVNGIATAIPATLVLFFMRDVLGADESRAAGFLAAYFLAGACGMPFWMWVARRFGLRQAWLLGMTLSVIGFVWALGFERDDMVPFLLLCIGTGLALGSDLAMPPALLAAVIAEHGDSGRREGAYFGVWNLATKLNLALAAGIALPLLEWQGYVPGQGGDSLPLTLVYAALPSALKLIAGGVLLLAPLPESTRRDLSIDGAPG